MKQLVLCVALYSVFSFTAFARPVSYPGAWTFITENNGDENNALMHYTLTPRIAVGYRMAYDRSTEDVFHGVQANFLAKRWNNPDSQANIYLKSAAGIVDERHDNITGESFVGTQLDWETRRYMVMYDNRAIISGVEDRMNFMQMAGGGIAPYVAEFGALHTWVMLHVMHQPEDDKNWQTEAALRFFKGPVLTEIGYNITKETPIFNAMIRF